MLDAAKLCAEVTLAPIRSGDFVDDASNGQVTQQLWIDDASAWEDLYNGRRKTNGEMPEITPGASFATTPVVLAVPKPLASAKTTGPHAWIDGLATLPLSAADVRESTPTALAFAAVWQQFANLPGGTDSISDAFFEIVRSQIPVEKAFENGADTKTAKAFPASEQEIYAWNTAHPDSPVSALTPTAAMPMVDYSVVRIGALDPAATKTAQALEAALVTPAAQEVFAKAGYRSADAALSTPLVDGVPATLPSAPVTIDQPGFVQIVRDMQRISRRQQVLNVVDVSGSMLEKAGGLSRIDLAVGAVNDSMAELPDDARAGLWVFSSDRQNGRDYQPLIPFATLGKATDAGSHRNELRKAALGMPKLLRGDTGLYDTIWAAYQAAQADYRPQIENLVMVITDGENDDPTGGLSEAQLIAKLKVANTSDKRVRLVLIGMGPATDIKAMRRVTDAVDGLTTVARNPADLSGVFASALWTQPISQRK